MATFFIKKKRDRFACRAYYEWMKSQPCAICGHHSGVDPHHSISRGRAEGGDDLLVPLDRGCHSAAHACKGTEKFFELHGKDLAATQAALQKRFLQSLHRTIPVGLSFQDAIRWLDLADEPYSKRKNKAPFTRGFVPIKER